MTGGPVQKPSAHPVYEDRECLLCHSPIASGDCLHIAIRGGQVVMSERAWEGLCAELAELRNRVGEES